MSVIQGNTVRALTSSGDFTMGNGQAGYLTQNAAVGQQAQCRCQQVIYECFWDQAAGINWYGFLSSANPQALSLALQTVILNGINVTGINSAVFTLDPVSRKFTTAQWDIRTVFSQSVPVNVNSPGGGN